MERIKAGYGYWDFTFYPIGGAFRRAGKDGVQIVNVKPLRDPVKGCDAQGETLDGLKVAFNSDHSETF